MIRIYRGPMSREKINEMRSELRAYVDANPGTVGALFYDSDGITSIAGKDQGPKRTLSEFSAQLFDRRAPGSCHASVMAMEATKNGRQP